MANYLLPVYSIYINFCRTSYTQVSNQMLCCTMLSFPSMSKTIILLIPWMFWRRWRKIESIQIGYGAKLVLLGEKKVFGEEGKVEGCGSGLETFWLTLLS